MSIDVRHDKDGQRFVADVDGHEAYLAYGLLDDRRVDFRSTFSPPELRGRGVAGVIVAKALEWARGEGLTVIPSCSYVAKYLERESSR
ncbi:N-acetyltransferase [bacterium]|nr:N-acetyltransferase [bacterium]